MSKIQLQEEHRAELELHVVHIKACDELFNKAQAKFEESKQFMQLLGASWKRIPKDNADNLDPVIIRNADIMSHALNDAREAERDIAFYSNCIQALKEAMAFFLAEHYSIDVTKDWNLNFDDLTLEYQE